MLKFKDPSGNVFDASVPYNVLEPGALYKVLIDDVQVGVTNGKDYMTNSNTLLINFRDHHGALIFEADIVQSIMETITSLPQLLAYGR